MVAREENLGPHLILDISPEFYERVYGERPRLTSRDSAPAGIQCEAKGGKLSGLSTVDSLRHHGALLGSEPWCTQRGFGDDSQ